MKGKQKRRGNERTGPEVKRKKGKERRGSGKVSERKKRESETQERGEKWT